MYVKQLYRALKVDMNEIKQHEWKWENRKWKEVPISKVFCRGGFYLMKRKYPPEINLVNNEYTCKNSKLRNWNFQKITSLNLLNKCVIKVLEFILTLAVLTSNLLEPFSFWTVSNMIDDYEFDSSVCLLSIHYLINMLQFIALLSLHFIQIYYRM